MKLTLEQLKKICGLYAAYQIRLLGVAENNSPKLLNDSRNEFIAIVESCLGRQLSVDETKTFFH